MDIKIYIFYEAVFIVIFSELLFALEKGLGDSKNFFKQKKNDDDKKRRLLSKVEQKKKGLHNPKEEISIQRTARTAPRVICVLHAISHRVRWLSSVGILINEIFFRFISIRYPVCYPRQKMGCG